jgi:hypothetical protein
MHLGQYISAWKDSTTSDPRQLSSLSSCAKVFLEPLLQHLDHNVPLSTRPQNRRDTVQGSVGHSKGVFEAIWEGVRCDRTSCTKL